MTMVEETDIHKTYVTPDDQMMQNTYFADADDNTTKQGGPSLGMDGDMEIISATCPTGKAGANDHMADVIPAGNVTFLLKNKTFVASRTISESTGEGQIILVECEGKEYVLKLYYPNFHYKEDILRTVWNMDMEFVMKVYDYGKTFVNGSERDYELMEFLRGGTLNKYQLGENLQKFRHIALQGAAALASLHNCGIIHKDIKPANFFFRDEEGNELVLGDFGISSMMKEGEEFMRTSQARTPAFAAPEMYDDVIDGEVEIDQRVDYYSLGITLLYIWLGHSPFGKNERMMMRMKQEGRLPHINELPSRVATIIRGLTSINPAKRWGFDEVERWFRGEDVPVDTSSAYLKYKTFILDAERNLSAHDIKELVPLLNSNPMEAKQFLYSKRISKWLDDCGNAKMAVMLNDIVDNRYPTQQDAGLAAAIYTLEPSFPYYDLHGQPCENLRELALSLMRYADEYEVTLQAPYNPLFSYIESKGELDVNRLRGYFKDVHDNTAIMKLVFEIDGELPFLRTTASSSIKEIIFAFASTRTNDEWKSIVDGRLLAWLYARHEIALCETTKVLMEREELDDVTRAYTILYSLDKNCGFDLKDAKNEIQVARLLEQELIKCQELSNEEFEQQLHPFISRKGRLYIYSTLHNWTRVRNLIDSYFNMESAENTDRFSLYDIRTAAYKLCVAIGGVPGYNIHTEEEGNTIVQSISALKDLPAKAVRDEMRQGSLKQWISIFFHENPLDNFTEPYDYEHSVERYLLTLGTYDNSEMHYKRYAKAEEQMDRKILESKQEWMANLKRQKTCMYTVCAMSAIWILLVGIFDIPATDVFKENIYYYVGIPVGFAAALVLIVWSYFRGHGFLVCTVWAFIGLLSSLIPACIMDITCSHFPMATKWVVLALSIIYIGFALKACLQKKTNQLETLSDAFSIDENKALIEKLYYTFKTKSFKFKGSNFSLMDDIVDESKASSYGKFITCLIWGVLILVLILLFVWYHPSMLNHAAPDIAAYKTKIIELYHQIKNTR